MSTSPSNTGESFDTWFKLASLGSVKAVLGMSEMVNQDIQISRLNAKSIPVKSAHSLLGGAEERIIGVYLTYGGMAGGHILLAFPEKIALGMIDLAMGLERGTTSVMGEMEMSAMGEIGNISGGFFLNELSDGIGGRVLPSPPMVIQDTAGSIMNVVISKVMQTRDDFYMMDLGFGSNGKGLQGTLLVVPTEGALAPI
jgi:chemotaxis protein CheC